jgi:peptide chain release factor subunit 1
VTVLTEDAVRSLSGFRGGEVPVTSCYLDVDGRALPSHLDVQRSFDQLVRRAGLQGAGAGEAHPSVLKDVERIGRHVQGFARSNGTSGVALFSSSGSGLWEVFELPVRVRSRLMVNSSPYVRPLEELFDQYEPFGVLLTDRQRARMFVFELGSLVEHTERVDPVERHGDDDRGELVKTRVDHQRDEQAQQHLRQAAQMAFEVYQRVGFGHLLLGAPSDVAGDVERLLHPYLRERLADRVKVAVSASDDDIRRAALEAAEHVERRAQARLVSQLKDAEGASGRAAHGLAPTVAAVNDHRVETLLVSAGFEAEGWRCAACRRLAVLGRRCPTCGVDMVLVPDLVEEAIEASLLQKARVESLVGNADLDVLGGIGALLRF